MLARAAIDPRLPLLLSCLPLIAAAACGSDGTQPSPSNTAGASGQVSAAGTSGSPAAGSGSGGAGSA
ncbi:MAG TPA: hypothetical protein VJV78_26275, partial [Polyangiales bacterium]|nr:hypothetical protein [Polyangiales bacterium]